MIDPASEKERRINLWHLVSQESLDDVEPKRLRELRIYGGAQGIWVDKTHTASTDIEADGATVSVLHTGRHYDDDLSDDGLIYHYPNTSRPQGRDTAEIQATKNAMLRGLPIFVVLPGKTSTARRSLKLGWVCDFDDENEQFLILFGQEVPPSYSKPKAANEPFLLMEEPKRKASTVMLRTGQQRFRFQVMSQYGLKCAVCDIRHPQLLKAAHICGKSQKGSDDWRNGIPLCSTHHDAFDHHFFCIDPASGGIMCKPGINQKDIGLRELRLSPLKNCPHTDALQWRWDVTQKEWSVLSTVQSD